MGDLVRRTSVALAAAESRELRTVRRQLASTLALEHAEAQVRDQRIDNGYRLAHHTAVRAAVLNGAISELSHDNPALEIGLRRLEQVTITGATALIADYFL